MACIAASQIQTFQQALQAFQFLNCEPEVSAALCLRGTFIDGPVDGAERLRPRAQSAPPKGRHFSGPEAGLDLGDFADALDAERRYVAALAPWPQSGEPGLRGKDKVVGVSDFDRQVSVESEEPSTRAPSVAGDEDDRDHSSERRAPETPKTPKRAWADETDWEETGPWARAATAAKLRGAPARSVRPAPTTAQSPTVARVAAVPTSAGHPFLCPRPCIFLARGFCAEGENCSYCHLAHTDRETHLDKRNREMLQAMSFAERVHVAMPLLREKEQELQLGPQAFALLGLLAVGEPCGAKPIEASADLAPRKVRGLLSALKAHSLRAVLTALCTGLAEGGPEREAAADLLLQLRVRMAEAEALMRQ